MSDELIEKQSHGTGEVPAEVPNEAPANVTGDIAVDVSSESVHAAFHRIDSGKFDLKSIAIGVAGWLVPGLGHALLKMWGRATAIFLAVLLLVYLGAGMRGNLFAPGGDDAFTRLGFAADLGTGGFYILARTLEPAGADVSHADGDYGTRFLATAGVLNLLAALHAYEAARGRKA
jgi:hypothetical protein